MHPFIEELFEAGFVRADDGKVYRPTGKLVAGGSQKSQKSFTESIIEDHKSSRNDVELNELNHAVDFINETFENANLNKIYQYSKLPVLKLQESAQKITKYLFGAKDNYEFDANLRDLYNVALDKLNITLDKLVLA